MGVYLPNFNLVMDCWHPGNAPPAAADVTGIPVQKYIPSKALLDITPGVPGDWVPPIYLRMARDATTHPGHPIVGTLFLYTDINFVDWYYLCRWWEIQHEGFTNEYLECVVEQCDSSRTCPDPNR